MANAQFTNTADSTQIFCDLKRPDGSTVEAKGGETFEVGSVSHPLAVLHELLQAVNTEAKKLVAEVKKALKAGETQADEVIVEVEAEVEKVVVDVTGQADEVVVEGGAPAA